MCKIQYNTYLSILLNFYLVYIHFENIERYIISETALKRIFVRFPFVYSYEERILYPLNSRFYNSTGFFQLDQVKHTDPSV